MIRSITVDVAPRGHGKTTRMLDWLREQPSLEIQTHHGRFEQARARVLVVPSTRTAQQLDRALGHLYARPGWNVPAVLSFDQVLRMSNHGPLELGVDDLDACLKGHWPTISRVSMTGPLPVCVRCQAELSPLFAFDDPAPRFGPRGNW
jgi:hypothetical protein